jgi:hypothetical protein
MDVDMPRRDGISATKQIRQDHPSVGVVVLTVHEDQETIFEAIKAGASGYLPKSATLDDIRSAVKAVAAGGSFLDPVQARKLLHQFNRYADETKAAADIYYLLTGREREPAGHLRADGQHPHRQHLPQAPRQQPGGRGAGGHADPAGRAASVVLTTQRVQVSTRSRASAQKSVEGVNRSGHGGAGAHAVASR